MGAAVPSGCVIGRKSILFEFESSPFLGDRLVQGARMALSLALDANVTLFYRGAAAVLAAEHIRFRQPARDLHDQERFLIEMATPIYVCSEDWNVVSRHGLPLRAGISVASPESLRELRMQSDIVFTL